MFFRHSYFCYAEVYKLDFSIGIKHDVLRLDISMNNILSMAMMEGLQKLIELEGYEFLVHIFLVAEYLIGKFTTCTELHDEVYFVPVFICFEVLDYVWMINLIQHHNLSFNHLLTNRVKTTFAYRFYCNLVWRISSIRTKNNLSEAALSKYLLFLQIQIILHFHSFLILFRIKVGPIFLGKVCENTHKEYKVQKHLLVRLEWFSVVIFIFRELPFWKNNDETWLRRLSKIWSTSKRGFDKSFHFLFFFLKNFRC